MVNMRRREDGGKVRPGRHEQGELVGDVIAGGHELLEHAELGLQIAGQSGGRGGELGDELPFPGADVAGGPLADGVEAALGADELGEVDRGQACASGSGLSGGIGPSG